MLLGDVVVVTLLLDRLMQPAPVHDENCPVGQLCSNHHVRAIPMGKKRGNLSGSHHHIFIKIN
jgi:hypothetical protein